MPTALSHNGITARYDRPRHRPLLASAAALALLAGTAGFSDASAFFWRSDPYSDPYPVYQVPVPQYRPKARPPRQHHRSRAPRAAKKSEPEKKYPEGPLTIIVSIGTQHLTLYANGEPVARTPVSTGVPGHSTPQGIFSVIQKSRYHRSNIYSNAPMPFMQRITWSGVALHEGHVTGRVASHGCIRMPGAFAQRLWGLTKIGARVIVTQNEVAPAEIAHPALFTPKAPSGDVPVVMDRHRRESRLEKRKPKPAKIRTAEAIDPSKATDAVLTAYAPSPVPAIAAALRAVAVAAPASGAMSFVALAALHAASQSGTAEATPAVPARAAESLAMASASLAADLSDDVAALRHAIEPQREATPDAASRVTDAAAAVFGDTQAPEDAVRQPPSVVARRSGAVSVFVSRRAGRLYVRQGQEPLFESPVIIHDPNRPLGTHVFTALAGKGAAALRWSVVTIPPPGSAAPEQRKHGRREARREAEKISPAPADTRAAAAALDRIEIPKSAVDRIAALVAPGASLIVSDYGISGETTAGTDFIVLTR